MVFFSCVFPFVRSGKCYETLAVFSVASLDVHGEMFGGCAFEGRGQENQVRLAALYISYRCRTRSYMLAF